MTFPESVELLRTHGSRVSEVWRARFVEAYPHAPMMLPPGERMPQMLIDATTFLLSHSPTETTDRVRAIALDLRRTGFPAEEYPNAMQLLGDAIRTVAGETGAEVGAGAEDPTPTLVAAGEVMRKAASQADYAGVPAASAAQVTSVDVRDGVQIVRLEAGTRIIYAPGETLPVMSPEAPGVWTGLIPALPSNPFGQMEFHISTGTDLAVAPGAWLTLGVARGGLQGFVDKQVLLVAAGTGLAAAKALVFHWLECEERPEVHLVSDVTYDRAALDALAGAQDWLDVSWVVESRLGASLEQVVSGPGMWWGRDVIVCADQARAAAITDALEEAGAEGVQVIAHDATPEWFSAS